MKLHNLGIIKHFLAKLKTSSFQIRENSECRRCIANFHKQRLNLSKIESKWIAKMLQTGFCTIKAC